MDNVLPETLGHIEENLDPAEHAPPATVFDADAIRHIRCAQAKAEDHRDATRAFVEKRAPRFKEA